jgi:hypothetical protein
MNRTDKLLVSCYVRHGDTCGLDLAHHDLLGCASRYKADDFVLVAKFAYLQEAIDYCLDGARRGCQMKLVSKICAEPFIKQYIPGNPGIRPVYEVTPEVTPDADEHAELISKDGWESDDERARR